MEVRPEFCYVLPQLSRPSVRQEEAHERSLDRSASGTVDRRTFLKRAGAGRRRRGRRVPPLGARLRRRRRTRPSGPIPRPSAAARCATPCTTRPPTSTSTSRAPSPTSARRARCTTRCCGASPKDGQTIIPDLAWRWEISPDGKKYTFHLRKGVKFHDGADFTAEDVKATYERIARPPKGVVIPRTPLFATVGDIVVVDPAQDRVPADRGAAEGVHAGRLRERLEHHRAQEDARREPGQPPPGDELPGHRAVPPRLAQGQGSLDQERNPDYWNKGLPLVDKLEIYHILPFSPELGAVVPVRARSTTRGCSTPSPGARPRRCRA